MSERADEPASARALADILREAGVSASGSGGRRRRRDDAQAAAQDNSTAESPLLHVAEPTGEGLDTDVGGLSSYFRTRSEVTHEQTAPHVKPPGLRPPHAKAADSADLLAPPRTDTGPLPTRGWSSPGTGWPETPTEAAATSAAASRLTAGSRTTPGEKATARGSTPAAQGTTSTTSHSNRSSSAVATTAPADPDEIESAAALRGGVASWAILAVELLAAVGLGVAAWYAFSAVWELLPYVAAFLGPLVVTGLVAVAGALRARTGRNPLGLPTLCILVFAGTVLVVLPAATVIIP